MLENKTKENNEFVPDSTRRVLYGDYIREIYKIACDNSEITQEKIDDDIRAIYRSKHTKWHDIWCDGKIVGFVIVGTGTECHPAADYFIVQTYVEPSSRKRGIGKQFLKDYIKEHPGVYCLDILDKNEVAHKFWAKVFYESGYSGIVLPYIPHNEGKGAHMYAWRKDC